MTRIKYFPGTAGLAASLFLFSAGASAVEAPPKPEIDPPVAGETATPPVPHRPETTETYGSSTARTDGAKADGGELSGPMEDTRESAVVLTQMKADDGEIAARMEQAHAVFVVPDYATASLLVGGGGGEGVLLSRHDGAWGSPAFYDIGNLDIGVQAGAAAGSLVMLLMSDDAVDSFRSDETDFNVTTQAGLTIVNWSAEATASEDGDIIVWTDQEGLLAEASIGVGGIRWDAEETTEYYGQEVTLEQVLAGDVTDPHASVLRRALAGVTRSGASAADGR